MSDELVDKVERAMIAAEFASGALDPEHTIEDWIGVYTAMARAAIKAVEEANE